MISFPGINSPQGEEMKNTGNGKLLKSLRHGYIASLIKSYIYTQVANVAEKYLRVTTKRQLLNFVSLIIKMRFLWE